MLPGATSEVPWARIYNQDHSEGLRGSVRPSSSKSRASHQAWPSAQWQASWAWWQAVQRCRNLAFRVPAYPRQGVSAYWVRVTYFPLGPGQAWISAAHCIYANARMQCKEWCYKKLCLLGGTSALKLALLRAATQSLVRLCSIGAARAYEAAGSPGTLSWMSRVWTVASWSQPLLLSPPRSPRYLACLLACLHACLHACLLTHTGQLARLEVALSWFPQAVSGCAEGPPQGRECLKPDLF